jgi:hypothetical protein
MTTTTETTIRPLHLVFFLAGDTPVANALDEQGTDLLWERVTLADWLRKDGRFGTNDLTIGIVTEVDEDGSLTVQSTADGDIYEFVHETTVIPLSFSDILELFPPF